MIIIIIIFHHVWLINGPNHPSDNSRPRKLFFFSFFDEKVKLKYASIYFPSSWSLKQHRILRSFLKTVPSKLISLIASCLISNRKKEVVVPSVHSVFFYENKMLLGFSFSCSEYSPHTWRSVTQPPLFKIRQ